MLCLDDLSLLVLLGHLRPLCARSLHSRDRELPERDVREWRGQRPPEKIRHSLHRTRSRTERRRLAPVELSSGLAELTHNAWPQMVSRRHTRASPMNTLISTRTRAHATDSALPLRMARGAMARRQCPQARPPGSRPSLPMRLARPILRFRLTHRPRSSRRCSATGHVTPRLHRC